MKKYEKMLDDLYKKLPEKVKEKSRFKMPLFHSFIQGKQTIIKNFGSVVTQIRREPEHLIKYLSRELATAGVLEGNRLILKGRFREEDLNKRLENYVKTYVLCGECNKPDTKLIVQDGILFIRCEACGARSPVPVIK